MGTDSTTPAPGRATGAGQWTALLEELSATANLSVQPKQARFITRMAARLLWHAGVAPKELRTRHLQGFLADLARRGQGRKSLCNVRSALSVFCRHLVTVGILADNPAAYISLKKPEQHPGRCLNAQEVAAVLTAARSAGIWPEVCLALSTGLRLSELRHLRWQDIDYSQRMLLVQKTKSGRFRAVPLSPQALAALREQQQIAGTCQYIFPSRYTFRGGWRWRDRPRCVSCWLRALGPVQAVTPKFREGMGAGRGWHLFRHTFISQGARAGVSLWKLACWCGHSDVRTTATIYAHLSSDYDPDIERAGPPSK